MHKLPLVTLLIGLVLVGIGIYVLVLGEPLPEVPAAQEVETKTYVSDPYGLSFSYSPTYYLKERNAGTTARPQLSVVLVEDTQENRDVIEGRSDTPREGPTAITVEVYPNMDRLAPEDWVRSDTNWTIRTSEAAPFGRGSLTGVTYRWDGLYSGKSVIATSGDRAYVFSVTWMTPEDAIIAEFDRILSSAQVAPSAPSSVTSIETYVRNNISTLSPKKEVLGGTFYVISFQASNGKGIVSYEDGHNAYTADFTYSIGESGQPSVKTFTVR